MAETVEKMQLTRRVIILILNWNGLKYTIECIESLKKINYPDFHIIVIDNGSVGRDAQALKEKYAEYVQVIENDRNYGFAGGINCGIKYALERCESDYLLLLNNDTTVSPDFLTILVDVIEVDHNIAIAGPRVLYYDHPDVIQNTGNKVNLILGTTRQIDTGKKEAAGENRIRQVDYVDTCLLIRTAIITQLGFFDESYFLYWEDADLGLRVHKAGYRVVCVPSSKIWHKKPANFGPWYQLLLHARKQPVSENSIYYFVRNRFKIINTYATKAQRAVFLTEYFLGYLWISLIYYAVRYGRPSLLRAYWRGVRDGVHGI